MIHPAKYRISFLLSLLILGGFSGPCDQESVEPEANLILDGTLEKGFSKDGLPTVTGIVKNIGLGTAYQGVINIDAHVGWNNSIVSSSTTTLNGGEPIAPGGRVSFVALLGNIKTHYQYDYLTHEIRWKRKNQQ